MRDRRAPATGAAWYARGMEASFWHARWQAGQIGFHHDDVNPYLVEHVPRLGLAPGARVLVPLCGKSVDLGWLADQGFEPVGVELSALAVAALFAERGASPERQPHGEAHECWRADGIEVWCGDFLELGPERIGRFDALWDRAALIALPESMRARYVEHCARLLEPGAAGLVVTLWYDPAEMEGPPFPVPPAEVEALYAPRFDVQTVAEPRPGKVSEHLRERGLRHVEEGAWRVTLRA